jgi:Fe2+ transport system protein FeoA
MNSVKSLTDLRRHEEGRISAIQVETPEKLQDLMRAGAMPGAQICVMHSGSRHVLFFAQDPELAVDRKTASGILVQTASMTDLQNVS